MGLDAHKFNYDPVTQWAFKSAVADQMPGVYPDEITFFLTTSLTKEVENVVEGRRYLETAASGIGILYNVTININRFGFTDPEACFDTLSGQLLSGLANGNFSRSIQEYSVLLGTDSFTQATSSLSDYTILQWVYVGQAVATQPPTSTPTQPPSSTPTTPPTPKPFRPIYFELVAGIVITAVSVGIYYITTVITGLLRADQKFEKKLYDEQKPNVDYLDVKKLTEHDLKIDRDHTAFV